MNDSGKSDRPETDGIWLPLAIGLVNAFMGGTQKTDSEAEYRASQDRSSRRTAYATIAMAAFTLAIFVLGIFQYVVFNRQLSVMQRQLNDAEIQEAASITLRNFSISGFPDKPTITVEVVNTGRTRADWITVSAGAAWVVGPNVGSLINQMAPSLGRNGPNEFGFSLGSGDPPRHVVTEAGPLPPPNMPAEAKVPTREEFISGNVSTMIYIVAAYRDVFGKSHSVVDCGAHFPGSNDAFISCFAGNRHYDNQTR